MLFPCLCFKHLATASPADPALSPRLDLLGGGGQLLLEKLSLVVWMSLAEQPPAFHLWGGPQSLSLAPQGAHGGCWAAVTAQPLARLFKLSVAQVRAPGCPSTPKNTPRPRFVVMPAQVRVQCPLVGTHQVAFAAAPRAGALTSPQKLPRGAQPQICPGFPFKIASSPPVPARRQQEERCTDEKCGAPKFIFQRWQQSQ